MKNISIRSTQYRYHDTTNVTLIPTTLYIRGSTLCAPISTENRLNIVLCDRRIAAQVVHSVVMSDRETNTHAHVSSRIQTAW